MLYQAELRSLPYRASIFVAFGPNCKREFRPNQRAGRKVPALTSQR